MRQDGCTCDAMEMAHLPGCTAMPMRDKAEIEAALRERINDHVTAVAKWALAEYRGKLRAAIHEYRNDRSDGWPQSQGQVASIDHILALLDADDSQ